MIRVAALAVLLLLAAPSTARADLDRTAVDFKTPAEIKWVKNAAGTNESVVLFGDPSKPGPYARAPPGPATRPGRTSPTSTGLRGPLRHLVDGHRATRSTPRARCRRRRAAT